MTETLALRRAGPSDAATLARIHHQVWVESYALIAPPEAVAALTEARRLEGWTALLQADDPTTLIAHDGDLASFHDADDAGLVAHVGKLASEG